MDIAIEQLSQGILEKLGKRQLVLHQGQVKKISTETHRIFVGAVLDGAIEQETVFLIVPHIGVIQLHQLGLDSLAHQPAHKTQPDKKGRLNDHFPKIQARVGLYHQPGDVSVPLYPGMHA